MTRKITWDNLQAGDYVESLGDKQKVLARVNDVVFLSRVETSGSDWETNALGDAYHIKELERRGYKIVQEKEYSKEQEDLFDDVISSKVMEKLDSIIDMLHKK